MSGCAAVVSGCAAVVSGCAAGTWIQHCLALGLCLSVVAQVLDVVPGRADGTVGDADAVGQLRVEAAVVVIVHAGVRSSPTGPSTPKQLEKIIFIHSEPTLECN